MNQKERQILELEESFKDTVEKVIAEQQTENKKIQIKDIKLVGQAKWKDKINGKEISDNVFIVEKEIIEIGKNGKERVTEQKSYYLGNKCIAGTLGNDQMIYDKTFENSEPDKLKAINTLLDVTPEEQIENNSMNKLRTKEIAEVLSAQLGRKIKEDEVQKILEDMDKQEIEELKEEKTKNKDKNNELTKKQADKIKVNQLQRVDLNQKADGRETLEKRLDLQGYKYIYVVYSEQVSQINSGEKINNTTYSLVGMKEDGTAKVLSDEFEMDSTVGNNASRMQTRINKDGTATRDNKNSSIFVRKSNKMSLSCRNDGGIIRMAMGQKTLEENEITETELGTSQTGYIPIENREVFNRNKGRHQIDKVQDEIQEHTDEGCNPKDKKDFDGDEKSGTHEHFKYTEIDENDYIPNTNMTWRQFANKCGYRGEGDIEKAVEVVNSLGSVNDKTLEEYIDDQEEEFDDVHQKR